MKKRKGTITLTLISLFIIIFVLDYFVLVKDGTNVFSIEHLMNGKQNGYMTQYGRLLHVNAMSPEWWRLLTYAFLHTGIVQLVVNCIGLYCVGTIVEKRMGAVKLILIFCMSAVVSGLVTTFITYKSVGSSGAIYGLIGVLFVLIIRNRKENWSNVALLNRGFVILFLIVSNINGVNSIITHEVGLISGIVLGLVLIDNAKVGETTEQLVKSEQAE